MSPPPSVPKRARPRAPRRRRPGLDPAWLFAAVTVGLALGVVGVRELRERGGLDRGRGRPRVVEVPQVMKALTGPRVVRTIYLNREGATLRPGRDDARNNVSSIVRSVGAAAADLPAFAGPPRRWGTIVDCVRHKFAAYDVEIVDQRPVDRDYSMVMVGGRPADLGGVDRGHGDGHAHSHATGLAPFNGMPIPDAVLFVFARALREQVRATCETAAMEIAHTYGLDHARHCRDLMTYMRPCGKRRFLDEAIPCGEQQDRPCKDGAATQNSHAKLLEILGPRRPAP